MKYIRDTLLHDIPEVVSPDLLEALAAMGRGDKIVVASLNFPAASTCRGPERPLLVRADGHGTADLLEAIVKLLPVENEVFYLSTFIHLFPHQTKTTQTPGRLLNRVPRLPSAQGQRRPSGNAMIIL